MAFNNVELLVVNQASVLLNNGPVTDLDSNDEFVVAARIAFDFVTDSEIASYNWRFATTIAELDLLVEKPELTNFNFKMRLPADLLAIDFIFPTRSGGRILIDYLPFEDNIVFTNQDELSVVYRRRGKVNKFPASFVRYLVYAVAEYLSISVTLQIKKAEYIEKKREQWLATAVFVDTQNYPAQPILHNPFVHETTEFGLNRATIIIGD